MSATTTTESAERLAAERAAEVEFRNVDEFTAQDLSMYTAGWLAARRHTAAIAQQREDAYIACIKNIQG